MSVCCTVGVSSTFLFLTAGLLSVRSRLVGGSSCISYIPYCCTLALSSRRVIGGWFERTTLEYISITILRKSPLSAYFCQLYSHIYYDQCVLLDGRLTHRSMQNQRAFHAPHSSSRHGPGGYSNTQDQGMLGVPYKFSRNSACENGYASVHLLRFVVR